jgi:hypothetical protein
MLDGSQVGLLQVPAGSRADRPCGRRRALLAPGAGPAVILDGNERSFFDSEARVALGFDLSRPLPQQVSAAERLLRLLQKRLQRRGDVCTHSLERCRDDWTLCLRALDAAAVGAEPKAVAQVLFPGRPDAPERPARVSNEGRRLVTEGYRDILLASGA